MTAFRSPVTTEGEPGFVPVLDDRRRLIPARPADKWLDGMRTVRQTPRDGYRPRLY